MRAVALFSGGLDSSVLAHFLRHQGFDLTLVSINYGQRHREQELAASKRIADGLHAEHHLVEMPWLAHFAPGSALTGVVPVPEGYYSDDSMAATVVRGRNATLLSVAYVVAAGQRAQAVAIAAHSGDHPIYRDCRKDFFRCYEIMQDAGMDPPVPRLVTPFVDLTKADIVRAGAELDVMFADTWSCYEGGVLHCGRCGTCVERIEAFLDADVTDPTVYEEGGVEYAKTVIRDRREGVPSQ